MEGGLSDTGVLLAEMTARLLARISDDGTIRAARSGTWPQSAWGRDATALVIEDGGRIALVTSSFSVAAQGGNMAAMPRDRIAVDDTAKVATATGVSLLEAGALVRTLAMARAVQTLLALTVAHVTGRVQFGRALAGFQRCSIPSPGWPARRPRHPPRQDIAAGAFVGASPQFGVAVAAARAYLGRRRHRDRHRAPAPWRDRLHRGTSAALVHHRAVELARPVRQCRLVDAPARSRGTEPLQTGLLAVHHVGVKPMLAFPSPPRLDAAEQLRDEVRDLLAVPAYTMMSAPSFSLRGCTREIPRGIIARGLGVR
jgi:hypothetical protein